MKMCGRKLLPLTLVRRSSKQIMSFTILLFIMKIPFSQQKDEILISELYFVV